MARRAGRKNKKIVINDYYYYLSTRINLTPKIGLPYVCVSRPSIWGRSKIVPESNLYDLYWNIVSFLGHCWISSTDKIYFKLNIINSIHKSNYRLLFFFCIVQWRSRKGASRNIALPLNVKMWMCDIFLKRVDVLSFIGRGNALLQTIIF